MKILVKRLQEQQIKFDFDFLLFFFHIEIYLKINIREFSLFFFNAS